MVVSESNHGCLLAHKCLQTWVWDVSSCSQGALQCIVATKDLDFPVRIHAANFIVSKSNTGYSLCHKYLQARVWDASSCFQGTLQCAVATTSLSFPVRTHAADFCETAVHNLNMLRILSVGTAAVALRHMGTSSWVNQHQQGHRRAPNSKLHVHYSKACAEDNLFVQQQGTAYTLLCSGQWWRGCSTQYGSPGIRC